MALTTAEVQQAYIAFFNRPADAEGLAYWVNYQGNPEDLLIEFAKSAEYLSDYQGLTNEQTVYKVYQNLFGRTPEPAGLAYWTGEMNSGNVTIGNVAYAILGGAQNEDKTTIDNKTTAATEFTADLDTTDEQDAYAKAGDNSVPQLAKDWLAAVDSSTASLDAARQDLGNVVQQLVDANKGGSGPAPTDNEIFIGYQEGVPIYAGTDGNDRFIAESGTLTDHVRLDGKGGTDTLEVTMDNDQATAPTVKNVENVVVRVQRSFDDYDGDNNIEDEATIDADRFSGVNRWQDYNSRADLKVEDVRILDSQVTKDITVAMVQTDPGHVDYALYFDPSSLRNQSSSSSVLDVTLYDYGTGNAATPLKDNVYDILKFELDGQLYSVNFGLQSGAATYQDLAAAIQAAIDADPVLSGKGIKVTPIDNPLPMYNTAGNYMWDAPGYVRLEVANGTLDIGQWSATAPVPAQSFVSAYQTVTNTTSSNLVTSTIELDYVGRGSMGGDLVIGSLSTGDTSTSKGVQQFDITVKRDSQLEVISSTNNTLQEVYIKNEGKYAAKGAYERDPGVAREGDLTAMGDTSEQTLLNSLKKTGKTGPYETGGFPDQKNWSDQDIDGATAAQNNGYAFTDVRVLNAHGADRGASGNGVGDGFNTAFMGNLKLNAILTGDVVAKYLNNKDAAAATHELDNRVFLYDLGNGNDMLDMAIASDNLAAAGTATREDFVLRIYGENGNDELSTAIYTTTGAVADLKGASQFLEALAYGVGNGAWVTAGGTLTIAGDVGNPWYANAKLNANLSVDGGQGNDTIRTFGSGDYKVTLDVGNDTYYADNSADKAVWVFNTANQDAATGAARKLDDLQSGANDVYINDFLDGGVYHTYNATDLTGLFGLKLRVVFSDVTDSSDVAAGGTANAQGRYIGKEVAVPGDTANKFKITDLNINQAIKEAINGDAILSKLLVATDGPSNTLVVTALSDGRHISPEDLHLEFAIPFAVQEGSAWWSALGYTSAYTAANDANLRAGRELAFDKLTDAGAGLTYATGANQDGWSNWYEVKSGTTGYHSAFANNGTSDHTGLNSGHTADNTIVVDSAAADQDVVVLSTGAYSNDRLVWTKEGNGHVTVVNFATEILDTQESIVTAAENNATAGEGADYLDFTAFDAKGVFAGVITTVVGANANTVANWNFNTSGEHSGGNNFNNDGADSTVPNTVGLTGNWKDLETQGSTQLMKAGDKYITLTRTDAQATADHAGHGDADQFVYKIELWTLNGTTMDAYTVSTVDASARDTAVLIGYVDVGSAIEGQTDGALSVLDNIAFFDNVPFMS